MPWPPSPRERDDPGAVGPPSRAGKTAGFRPAPSRTKRNMNQWRGMVVSARNRIRGCMEPRGTPHQVLANWKVLDIGGGQNGRIFNREAVPGTYLGWGWCQGLLHARCPSRDRRPHRYAATRKI